MFEVRRRLIDDYIGLMNVTLGGVKKPVDIEEYRRFFDEKNYTDIAGLVRNQLSLPIKLRIGYVNQSGKNHGAQAWIGSEELFSIPEYGTVGFSDTKITLYIRKEIIQLHPIEITMYTFAHELSHVLLHSKRHLLCEIETAVDLCAMMMGFADVIITGKRVGVYSVSHQLKKVYDLTGQNYDEYQLGYLSKDEAEYAYKHIISLV